VGLHTLEVYKDFDVPLIDSPTSSVLSHSIPHLHIFQSFKSVLHHGSQNRYLLLLHVWPHQDVGKLPNSTIGNRH
jgi:predicted SprT family Zn-dependent metalloprotease